MQVFDLFTVVCRKGCWVVNHQSQHRDRPRQAHLEVTVSGQADLSLLHGKVAVGFPLCLTLKAECPKKSWQCSGAVASWQACGFYYYNYDIMRKVHGKGKFSPQKQSDLGICWPIKKVLNKKGDGFISSPSRT